MKNIQKIIMWMLFAASLMVSGCASSSSEMVVDKGVPSPDSFTLKEQVRLATCIYDQNFYPISEKEKFVLILTRKGGEKLGVNSLSGNCLIKLAGAKIVDTFPQEELPYMMEYMRKGYIDGSLGDFRGREVLHPDDVLWKEVAKLYSQVFPYA